MPLKISHTSINQHPRHSFSPKTTELFISAHLAQGLAEEILPRALLVFSQPTLPATLTESCSLNSSPVRETHITELFWKCWCLPTFLLENGTLKGNQCFGVWSAYQMSPDDHNIYFVFCFYKWRLFKRKGTWFLSWRNSLQIQSPEYHFKIHIPRFYSRSTRSYSRSGGGSWKPVLRMVFIGVSGVEQSRLEVSISITIYPFE